MPFKCEAFGYRVAIDQGKTNSYLSKVNILTGESTIVNNDIGLSLNAIGYNVLDNLIYGIGAGKNLISMDELGVVTNLGAVENMNTSKTVGAIDGAGHLFVTSGGDDSYFVIDVNKDSDNFGKLLDPTNSFALDTEPFGTVITNKVTLYDWGFNFNDGFLYGVVSDGRVSRMNPTTGVMQSLTTTGIPSGSAYGSIYSISDGFIYATSNNTGIIYRIKIDGTNATAEVFSQDIPSSFNDGASCLNAELEIDFGDAPDTDTTSQSQGNYRTLLASNGPRHAIFSDIKLGSDITGELDAYQSADALGDDQGAGIQDDGTILPLKNIARNATSYKLTETVFNNTGKLAHLYAWVDFNKNGIFETNEGASVVVPSSATLRSVDLIFNVPADVTLIPGETFVRVRFTTDILENIGGLTEEDTRSFGPASDGEVEDYLLIIEDTKVVATKTSTPENVNLNDVVSYTVEITNPGTLPINNVLFTDSLPTGTSYLGNLSVDTEIIGTDPMTGLTILTIDEGETVTISWDVSINEVLPEGNKIENVGVITIDGIEPIETNTTITNINYARVDTVLKTVDLEYADIGDEIKYEIKFTNIGSVKADNVVITDIIPAGTSLVTGSLAVEGRTFTTENPELTVKLDESIEPEEEVKLAFKVLVDEMPQGNSVTNLCNVKFDYLVEENGTPVQVDKDSNEVITNINHGEIPVEGDGALLKAADKDISTPGDVITYTISFKNTGNVDITDVIINDVVPVGTRFNLGSTIINGDASEDNPNFGINIDSVAPNQLVEVSFAVTVLEDCPDAITNSANVSYKYLVNPEESPKAVTVTSNTEEVTILRSSITVNKEADRTGAIVGDIIRYSITVVNIGQLDLNSVIITDKLEKYLSFEGNVTIEKFIDNLTSTTTAPEGSNIIEGIEVGALVVGETAILSFDTKVISVPELCEIRNKSIVKYGYEISESNFELVKYSNTVLVDIFNYNLKVTKSTCEKAVRVGDIFEYMITLENCGNIMVQSVVIQDSLPESFEVIDITVDGITEEGNINEGIQINNLGVGKKRLIILKLKVISDLEEKYNNIINVTAVVISDPVKPPTQITESAEDKCGIEVFNPSLTLTKSASKQFAVVGEVINYEIIVANTGDVKLNNIILKDALDESLKFICGTVYVNDIKYDKFNIMNGIQIKELLTGESMKIKFDAKIVAATNVIIKNKATATYCYVTPCDKCGENHDAESAEVSSNEVIIEVKLASISIIKSSDVKYVVINDIVTYTVSLENVGELNAIYVIFKDRLPQSLKFIEGTFKVGTDVIENVDLESGVELQDIATGDKVTISYKAEVIDIDCTTKITNAASVQFNYVLPNDMVGTIIVGPVNDVVEGGITISDQIKVEKHLGIPVRDPDMEDVKIVKSSIGIVRCAVTEPRYDCDNDAVKSSRIDVLAILRLAVSYSCCKKEEGTKYIRYDIPFNYSKLLPEGCEIGSKIDIEADISELLYEVSNCRGFDVTAGVLLILKIFFD